MAISTRQRFLVLQRDGFACQYCGARAPQAKLHVDHVHPASRGGEDDFENLITACWECNMGKGVELVVGEVDLKNLGFRKCVGCNGWHRVLWDRGLCVPCDLMLHSSERYG
jgi:hypothetical protein